MRILRCVIAVPLGCFVLLLTFLVIDRAGFWLFPLPEAMRTGETTVAEVIASRPFGAVLFNFLLRVPAVFVSAWLAARIAPRFGMWHGSIVTLLFLTLILGSAMLAPFPLWVTVLGAVCFPISGYLGARLGTT